VSVSCVSTDVLVAAETSPTESLQCLDICLLMSCFLSFRRSQSHVVTKTWSPKVAEVEESEMVSQEFGISIAFARPAGVKTSPAMVSPMMAIV
jgi:hypothetical protein